MLLSPIKPIKKTILTLLFVFASFLTQAQGFSSNLPIIIITTPIDKTTGQPTEIPDEPKINAYLTIVYRPTGRTYLSDTTNISYINYKGAMQIETRGSSSQALEKKPYGLTLTDAAFENDFNASLLGLPEEHDWVLNALNFDPSRVRDCLIHLLARQLGNYSSQTKYCELFLNGNYRGIYLLMEKIKPDQNRVNIAKMDETSITSSEVTGGYIIKADKLTGGDEPAWSMLSYGWPNYTDFIYDYPKAKNITPQQKEYIYNQFYQLQTKANQKNNSISNGYPSVIDIPSFIDYILLSEFGANPDAYQYSTYFHKDKGGKLRAGPLWDFNLSFGNDLFLWGLDRSLVDGWQIDNGDNNGAQFWYDLFNESKFRCYLTKRWHEVIASEQPLNSSFIAQKLDSLRTLISEAASRDMQRWNDYAVLPQEIYNINMFVINRTNWINSQLKGYSACQNPQLPSLVISKIHYHPAKTDQFPFANKQEFIEITNTSNSDIDATGIYLRQPGVTYQFPAGTIIKANSSIYIAGHAPTFYVQYGQQPIGVFYRDLPNSGFDLILADAFGNTIDEVNFTDKSPWPIEADGEGSFLKLTDTNSDNALAANWEAANDMIKKDIVYTQLTLFPNPASSIITVGAAFKIKQLEIYNSAAQLVYQAQPLTTSVSLQLNHFAKGIYLIRVSGEGASQSQRFIIQ